MCHDDIFLGIFKMEIHFFSSFTTSLRNESILSYPKGDL